MAMDEEIMLPVTQTQVVSAPAATQSEAVSGHHFTIENYLRGLVRNITIDDNAMMSVLMQAQVAEGTLFIHCSEREVKLCTAYLYVWLSNSPVTSERRRDADGNWSHEEGGEVMSSALLNRYLAMANQLFRELDMPVVGSNKWGFRGNGFRNIRYTNGRGRNMH